MIEFDPDEFRDTDFREGDLVWWLENDSFANSEPGIIIAITPKELVVYWALGDIENRMIKEPWLIRLRREDE